MNPRARREGLVVRSLAEETLVYDRERHQAHCLNRTATFVFVHADGSRTIREIAASLASGGGAEPIVEEALRQLAQASLLEGESVDQSGRSPSRRELLRSAGVGAALLLPAIVSVVAPTPAQAASCVNDPTTQCTGKPNGTPACDPSLNCICCDTEPGGYLCPEPPTVPTCLP